jgi:hypothetical protein
MAARADGGRTLPGSHGDFDALFVGPEAGMLVCDSDSRLAHRTR